MMAVEPHFLVYCISILGRQTKLNGGRVGQSGTTKYTGYGFP